MKFIYKTKIVKWFFKKYFGINKEVFKVDKNAIHFWVDKEIGQAQCRQYQFNVFDIPVLRNLKRLALIPILLIPSVLVKIPLIFGLTTDVTSINGKNSHIYNLAANTNFGSDASGDIYCNSALSDKNRGLYSFTLSSGSGTISKISLFLYQNSYYTANSTINIHSLTQHNWTQAGMTWNKYDGTNAWTTAGGDYNATVICHSAITTGARWLEFVLLGTGSDNPLTLTWGDLVDVLAKVDNEAQTTRGANVNTKNAASNKPYIEITYTAAVTTNASFLLLMV